MWKLVFLAMFFPCTLHAFWPVYWEFGGEKRFLGPLISYQKENDVTRLTIRPFLFSYDSEDGGIYNYLYPLGKSTKDKSYFVPFYLSHSPSGSTEPSSHEGTSDKASDSSLLLFFFGTSPQGNYGGFFPFYGRLNDRFGNDKIGFFMWPLYSYAEKDGALKTNLLTPFFSVYSGAEKGFRLWPLYGTREREGIKKSSFFLWPIFYSSEDRLEPDNPVDTFYAIPFYLSSRSKTKDEYMIMGPLYWHSKDQYREKTTVLWPFFSSTKGEDTGGYSLFPFISSEKKLTYDYFGILWPVGYTESTWYIKDRRYTKKRVLLLNRYDDEEDGFFFNVWPIFEHTERQGRSTTLMPSPLPLKFPEVDRIIKPLFALVEHREEGDKERTSFLYGLCTTEKAGEDWKVRFAFLLELKKESGRAGFEVLSGLFGIDSSRIKILFIPFRRANSGS